MLLPRVNVNWPTHFVRYFKQVKTIIGLSHGSKLQKLQLMNVNVSIVNLLILFHMTPHLKLLKLFFVNKTDNQKKPRSLSEAPKDELPAIEDLIIYECGRSMEWLMEYLRDDTVLSLTIRTEGYNDLINAFRSQSNILKMNLMCDDDSPPPVNLLKKLRLTHLTLNLKRFDNLSEILAQQQELEFLDTSAMTIDNDTFLAITKLPLLAVLAVNVSSVSHIVFTSIAQMQQLRILTLKRATFKALSILLDIQSLELKTLELIDCGTDNETLLHKVKSKMTKPTGKSTYNDSVEMEELAEAMALED